MVKAKRVAKRGAKTGAIRQAILRSGNGMTAGEVREAVGKSVDPKYLYKTLAKLKNRGEIRMLGSKYYPKADGAAPAAPRPAARAVTRRKATVSAPPIATRLNSELERMKRAFDEYQRGYRDGWTAARQSS